MSMRSTCCSPELRWKTPKLNSVPIGMAEGLKVTVGCVPDDRHHSPHTGLPASLEEVRELRLLVAHSPRP